MNSITATIAQLEGNAAVFKQLFEQATDRFRLWKPTPEKWCLLEVLCHLYDEELEDFRYRVKHTLETPDKKMPPIDPEEWVNSRNYINQDFDTKLNSFLAERTVSVQWLRGLTHPNWGNAYQHPMYGALAADFFLHNWLAHDYLHLRQIMKLQYDYLEATSKKNLLYAGGW